MYLSLRGVKRRSNLCVLIALMFFVSGCATTGFALSEQKEVSIGAQADERVKKQFGGEYYDVQLQEKVNKVGFKLAAVSERPRLYYHITILDDDEVNAMAVPGGYVYVTRGMLDKIDTEAQLAAVLGHEIGHIALRHGAKRIEQQMTMDLLFGVASIFASRSSEKTAGRTARILRGVSVAYDFAALGYGRQDELAADVKSVEYLHRAGYDPHAAIEVLEMIQEEERQNPRLMLEFLSTHPKTEERIAVVKQAILDLED